MRSVYPRYLYRIDLLKSMFFQPSQPLLRIINLSNTRVSVSPEVEEFLLVFNV